MAEHALMVYALILKLCTGKHMFKSSQHISCMTLEVLWNNEKGEI